MLLKRSSNQISLSQSLLVLRRLKKLLVKAPKATDPGIDSAELVICYFPKSSTICLHLVEVPITIKV